MKDIQTTSPRIRSAVCGDSFARYSEKFFTQIYKALYGDAMMVPIRMGTNMAAVKKHSSLRTAIEMKRYYSRAPKHRR